MVDSSEQDEMLASSEQELLEVAKSLRVAVASNEPWPMYALSLAHRSCSFFSAFVNLTASAPENTAAQALIRPLVEMNINLRFVKADPVVRVALWSAERDRTTLTLDSELYREKLPPFPARLLSPERRAQSEAFIRETRANALAVGTPGVGERGALFPGLAKQVATLNDHGATQGYILAYRSLSASVHVGELAFRAEVFQRLKGGGWLIADAVSRDERAGARSLAIATFASTLTMISTSFDLGFAERVDEIKRRVIPHERPLAERLG